MSQDSPVGFVVFGFGRAGSIHANNLIRNSQARLKYIVDIDEEKAKEFVKSNYLDTKVVPPSAKETALGDPTVTAAVITTPTQLHHENQVLSCFIPSPQSAVHFYNIDIVDQEKKSRPTKTFAAGKIFLDRQKDFSADETDFSCDKCTYYINTNEIPGELSRENMISSHVKIPVTCYLHMPEKITVAMAT